MSTPSNGSGSGSNNSSAPKSNPNTSIPTDVPKGTSTKEGIAEAGAAATKKYKVKIDGAEQEVDEAELLRGYSHASAANKAFQDGQRMRKQAEEFIHLLKTDPVKVLKDPRLGHDVRKLAEEYLVAQMEEEMMDPKDKELRDTKRQLQEIEDQKKAAKEAEDMANRETLKKQYTEDYTKQIVTALQSTGLPQTEHTVKRMAYYVAQAVRKGNKNVKFVDVADMVRQDYINEQKALLSALDGDTLMAILGDETVKKVQRYQVQKLKSGGQPYQPAKNQPAAASSKSSNKKLSKEEWKEKLERIKRGEE